LHYRFILIHPEPSNIYNIKEFIQPKISLNNREFLSGKKEEGGGRG
jgi:hypothetical protein